MRPHFLFLIFVVAMMQLLCVEMTAFVAIRRRYSLPQRATTKKAMLASSLSPCPWTWRRLLCARRQNQQQQQQFHAHRSFSVDNTDDSNTGIFDVDNNNNNFTGWTVQQVLKTCIEQFHERNVTEAVPSAHHLLSSSLVDLSWESGFHEVASGKYADRKLTAMEARDFVAKLHRRLQHEPIQYIVGQWDFLDYTVIVRPPLLCPRPETEELVLKVLEDPATTESPLSVLDVGCGTGVIGLALAERLGDASVVDAIDIDPIAIQVSMENARRILDESEQQSYHVTLTSAAEFHPPHKYDIVVSNPPYIPQTDMATLSDDVVRHESHGALCGGEDGMDVIRTIIEQLPQWCHPGGVCWMEVDPTHPVLIQTWLKEVRPDLNEKVILDSSYKDMFGKDRFVKLVVR